MNFFFFLQGTSLKYFNINSGVVLSKLFSHSVLLLIQTYVSKLHFQQAIGDNRNGLLLKKCSLCILNRQAALCR